MNSEQQANPRWVRGLEIANTKKIERKDSRTWIVPSATTNAKYTVRPHAEHPYCSCKDHEALGVRCKHVFAVEILQQRELSPDGTEMRTATVTVTEKVRKTYAQDWAAYNAAQTNEKDKFLQLLHDLCSRIEEPPQAKGRKRVRLADAVFMATYKIYTTFSSRRFMSDLRDAEAKGYISKARHFNSVLKAIENPDLFPILQELIVKSSQPLKAVDADFAVDSSGFSMSRFDKWVTEKYGDTRSGNTWIKVHICCGTKTNIIAAVEIRDRDTHDSPMFSPLVRKTAETFKISEVSGDKAYGSRENYNVVDEHGGTAFIAFKRDATGGVGGLYAKMFHYFCYRQQEFLNHYHKRSNVESTFSMIKAKFRDSVRSKTEAAAKNECLLKILAHNICVLIQQMYELGIEPEFFNDKSSSAILPLKRLA